MLAAILGVLFIASVSSVVFAAQASTTDSRCNIVFVTDESGSMKTNDPNGMRHEAIRRFVAFLTNEGNKVGSVSFNDDIRDYQEMVYLNGLDKKNAFCEEVSKFKKDDKEWYPNGQTDIGEALEKAVALLDAGRDPSLPSVIILLTDGCTDLGDKKANQDAYDLSYARQDAALEAIKKAGYTVFAVSLGTEAESELQNIVAATGGSLIENFALVQTQGDLKELLNRFNGFYAEITGAKIDDKTEHTIGADGQAHHSFTVSDAGLEELNITIEGKITDCTLRDPNGKVYTQEQLNAQTMISGDFRLIKITDPMPGNWLLSVSGAAGTKIEVQSVHNSSFGFDPWAENLQEEYKEGDVVKFGARLYNTFGNVKGAEGKLYIKRPNEKDFSVVLNMTADENGEILRGEYALADKGTYYVYIELTKDEFVRKSEEYVINVGNRVPTVSEEMIKAHVSIWPFFGGKTEVDLGSAVTDPDGDKLIYSIDFSAFGGENYELDDDVLHLNLSTNSETKRGVFTIRATDEGGAYCTFDVQVTYTNVGLVILILIVVGALIVLAAMAYATHKLTHRTFYGDIKVSVRQGGIPVSAGMRSFDMRGPQSISTWSVDTTAFLPKGTKIQPGTKKQNCIFVVFKKPVYNDLNRKGKKFKIMKNSFACFRKDIDMVDGVTIEYNEEGSINNGPIGGNFGGFGSFGR